MSLDQKVEYLKLIQGVIERMSRFGFLIKGWAVTLVSAIFVLAAEQSEQSLLFIAIVVVVSFWYLDTFFLHTEHKYRSLYSAATKLDPGKVDFDLNPNSEKITNIPSRLQVMFSLTFLLFWLALLGAIVVAALIIR